MNNVISDASTLDAAWTKSSFSGAHNDCVEVALSVLPTALPVRDSKNPSGPAIVVPDSHWGVFVDAVKHGTV